MYDLLSARPNLQQPACLLAFSGLASARSSSSLAVASLMVPDSVAPKRLLFCYVNRLSSPCKHLEMHLITMHALLAACKANYLLMRSLEVHKNVYQTSLKYSLSSVSNCFPLAPSFTSFVMYLSKKKGEEKSLFPVPSTFCCC